MRIKSLQLVGFKSFYDKTSIQCHSGINAIVGPNGCGKSNILDAMRWILGEQNPRKLRAEGMDEVISNGSEALKPLGMAEVTMIITDVAKQEFEEIEIKRRLFRSGESEYYINGMPCRLRDISEMFLDTGVGARAYSVIAQGRVEQLITAKPEEKRMLIEEVAGILKYKVRRRETESRIKSTNENLARVKDIIKEVKHQMRILSRQAGDAQEFNNISKEVRRTEVGINRFKIFELDIKRKGILDDKSQIDERISNTNGLIKGRDELLDDLDARIKPLEQKFEDLEKEIIQIRSNQQSKQAFEERVLSEISGIDLYIGKLEGEIVLLKEEMGRIGDQIDIKKSNLEEIKAERTSKQSELIKKEESLSNLRNRLTQERSEFESSRPALFETLDKYSSKKGIVFGFEKELNELKSRRDRIINEMREVKDEREKTFKFISELEQRKGKLEEQKYQIKNNNEEIQSKFSSLSEDQDVKKEESIQLKERQNEVYSRLDVLKQVQSNYEWLPEGIRKFLVERKGNGILGLTADFISVQKGYEKAIEAALGERLKWIFVKENEEAIAAIESLRELSVGRGTFIPISSEFKNGNHKENGKGILSLRDKVMIEGFDADIIDNMLDGIFVVSSLKEAIALRNEMDDGASFVTVDGDYLDSTGAISGGFANEGVFERKREIGELSNEIHTFEDKITNISTVIESNFSELQRVKGALQKSEKELVEIDIKEAEINKDISNIRENLVRIGKRHEVVERELIVLDSEITEKDRQIDQLNTELRQIESERVALERRYGELEKRVRDFEGEEKNLESEIANLRVENATLIEKEKSIYEDIGDLNNRQKDIGNRIEVELKEIEQKKDEKSNLYIAREKAREEAKNLLGDLEDKEQELSVMKFNREELLNKTNSIREDKEGLRQELSSLQEKSHSIQLQINSLQIEIEHIENEINKGRFGIEKENKREDAFISGDQYLEDFDLEMEEAKLNKLKEKLEKFGPVNLLAPEEFTNLEERYNFLNDQMEDLLSAISSLRKAINKIDGESTKRFNEAFEVINKKFQEVFKRLFRGGDAKLILTDPDDIPNTGVEVMVKPGGKKFQSVNLLSGGEKALSAIALVISACFVKPSPFLLFDEIDAPLDDINTSQFIALLKEIARKSQVLIITHNKKTMQAVDSLIGITVDESSTSKVVSVELQAN